ncbi:MAG: acetate/propionate family kinase, partial [Gammaproteobacteria bacterium]|nr:acetate/propionate family kinase [Gammaproteobacteria bacterium]
IPNYAFTYAVPSEWYKKFGVRRYGFHGTSHRFVTREAAKRIEKPLEQCSFISAHLGNGCSIAAVRNGKSVDTSMGLTPLEGLVMGTRCGDTDPSVHAYMAEQLHCNVQEITNLLNRKSGLLGLSGISADMRQIIQASEAGNEQARLAIEVSCYRLAKYVMAYMVPLQRLDALIFTGGIGENAKEIRAKTIEWLAVLNMHLDSSRNDSHGVEHKGLITTDASTPAYVIPTNEELLIAQDTLALISTD